MNSIYESNLSEHINVCHGMLALSSLIEEATNICGRTLNSGGKVFFCGNGGSAADCQHLAAEFTGRFCEDRIPLAGCALSTDSSVLTCISNDYSFEQVFSRQLAGLARPGDLLVAISTSGNSGNIIHAVNTAKEMGVGTIGLLGKNGGTLKKLCDLSIVVPSSSTARTQEAHILIGHTICEGVEHMLGFTTAEKEYGYVRSIG